MEGKNTLAFPKKDMPAVWRTELSTHLLRWRGIANNTKHSGILCSVHAAAAAQCKVNSAKDSGLSSLFGQKLGKHLCQAQTITAKIAKVICKEMRLNSAVENPWFCEINRTLNTRYRDDRTSQSSAFVFVCKGDDWCEAVAFPSWMSGDHDGWPSGQKQPE